MPDVYGTKEALHIVWLSNVPFYSECLFLMTTYCTRWAWNCIRIYANRGNSFFRSQSEPAARKNRSQVLMPDLTHRTHLYPAKSLSVMLVEEYTRSLVSWAHSSLPTRALRLIQRSRRIPHHNHYSGPFALLPRALFPTSHR